MTTQAPGPWVEQWLSPDRFGSYLRLAGGSRSRALALHEWNTCVNAALLHDFAHLEVGLRNMYNNALHGAHAHGDNHWTDTRSATVLFPQAARTHADLEKARRAAGGPSAPPGKIMAELTFGFWVLMTSSRNAPLIWQPHLQDAFSTGSNRQQIHSGLDELRKLRNRVAHHEPVNRSELNGSLRRMRRFTNYVAPELTSYLESTSQVPSLLAARP
ncbi:MAG: Abi family protein [Rhodococcus sp. (in: high G+C Gram-positive bacteria)]|uniref:CAAX protease n=1 Tax=Rhodococcus sp. TaxID=1831 RepID=UPI002ADA4DE2|nr:Abi family protein [Rhodococcus sp. (in: high G+C Gram-positive bacteria)]